MSKDFNHFLSNPKNFSDFEGQINIPAQQNDDQSLRYSSILSIKLLLSTGALRFLLIILNKNNIFTIVF